MSTFNQRTKSKNNKSGSTKVVVIVAVLLVVLAAGYLLFANAKGMWPFGSNGLASTQMGEPSVEITKATVKKDVLAVGVKVENTGEEKGYCVLELSGKRASLKIDDSETREKSEVAFEDCEGWSVGVKDLPAGKYEAKVTYVGANEKVTTTKEVTVK